MSDPVDTIRPWTIKSLPTRTQGMILAAAKREGLTVGQWLERRVDEWANQGSPEPRGSLVSDLAELIRAFGTLPAEEARLPKELRTTINALARQMRVIPSFRPRQTETARLATGAVP